MAKQSMEYQVDYQSNQEPGRWIRTRIFRFDTMRRAADELLFIRAWVEMSGDKPFSWVTATRIVEVLSV